MKYYNHCLQEIDTWNKQAFCQECDEIVKIKRVKDGEFVCPKGYNNHLKWQKYKNKYDIDIDETPIPDECEVCKKKTDKLCADHDHKTGKFRGWICSNCNVALGMVNDNISILMLLIKYLLDRK